MRYATLCSLILCATPLHSQGDPALVFNENETNLVNPNQHRRNK